MTTHGSILFKIGDQYRISEAATDGFINPYIQNLFDHIRKYVNIYGEKSFYQTVKTSTQVMVDRGTGKFNTPRLVYIAGVSPEPLNARHPWGKNIWELVAKYSNYTAWDKELISEEVVPALLSTSFAHNFYTQLITGCFYRHYNKTPYELHELTITMFAENFSAVVDMDERNIYVTTDEQELVSFSFDTIFSQPFDVKTVIENDSIII